MRNQDQKIEGYWYSEYTPEYPKPVPEVLSISESLDIAECMMVMQEHASKTHYKGHSTSRITGEAIGSGEYQTDEWRWPEDLASHYVLKHKVRPTDDFLKFIGYG